MARATTARGGAYLTVTASPDSSWIERRIQLADGALSIGRGHDCDLRLLDPAMSRRHVVVRLGDDGTLRVEDQASSNRMIVNGRQVSTATLEVGGQFSIGRSTFRFARHRVAAEAPEGPSPEMPSRTQRIRNLDELLPTLDDPFEEQGRGLELTASAPLPLTDPDVSWWVLRGHVDLFAVPLVDGRPYGERTHVATVRAGGVFFHPDPQDYGDDDQVGFIAVGKAAAVREIGIDHVQVLVRRHRARVAQALDAWITALGSRLPRDRMPRERTVVRPTAEPQSVSGVLVGQGVTWIEVECPFFVRDETYQGPTPLFPLAPDDWLALETTARAVTARAWSTAEALVRREPWLALELYHRAFAASFLLQLKMGKLDDAVRLRQRAREWERVGDEALGAIKSVMGGTKQWRPRIHDEVPLEPLLEACRHLGRAQGFEVRPHPYHHGERKFDDALADIAVASGFRVRQIWLEDGWWTHEIGHFLAPRRDGKSVVVMLQGERSWWRRGVPTYTCIDPVTGEERQVDRALARELTGFGHVLYRPFPSDLNTLGARELGAFALRDLGAELRVIVAMGVGLGLLSMVAPFITGKIYDVALLQSETTMLLHLSLGLALAACATAAFQITQKIAVLRVQGKADYSAQAAVWDRLLELPVGFFHEFTAGDLSDRAGGVSKIRGLLARVGVSAILGSVASLFNAVQMGVYSWKLAVVAVLLTVAYVFGTWLINVTRVRLQRDEFELRGRIHGLMVQLIGGMAKLRVSGAEVHAFHVWAQRFARQRSVAFKSGHRGNWVAVVNAGYTTFTTLVLFFVMVQLKEGAAERGETFDLSTGDFLAFMAAFGIFSTAVQALGTASVDLLQVLPMFDRLRPVLQARPEVREGKMSPGALRGAIEISNLSFRYDPSGPPVLDNLSLSIPAAGSVAIVGSSGSGKSTLLRLLLGFEQPERGSILYDGQDLSMLDLRLLRQQLGVVLQDSKILPADILRNIVGASSRTEEEAWAAAAKAGLERDIRRMPMTIHTVISEGGGGLSGGQKQRLMIARALVNEPAILLFDEATSALDNETQLTVQKSLEALQVTRVVIAHRLSTIRNVETIFYLHEGKVAESGSYDELMARGGLFAAMAVRQELE
ncbi:MAG: NHLP bacteriocin export ABC transporter permease/ATPase subunit [Acidobacteriota bacterium]